MIGWRALDVGAGWRPSALDLMLCRWREPKMSDSTRPDEVFKYAPRWLREGTAKPDAILSAPAPQIAIVEDELPWCVTSPFDDPKLGVEQTLDPPASVDTFVSDDTLESDLLPFGAFKRSFKSVGHVSFALIAMLTLALLVDDTLTRLGATPAEAITTASDEAPVRQITATAPSVTNVEYVVTGSNSPASLETQPQQMPDPQLAPQTEQIPVQRVSARVLGPEEVEQLIHRGETFLAQGDVAAARLFLERAADARDPRATLMLGTTYDPDVLRRMGAVGIRPDPQQAHQWYAQAAEFGSHEARQRLAALILPAR
jgi:hypothetical protein